MGIHRIHEYLRLATRNYQTGQNIPNGGMWVANANSDVEGLALLLGHKKWEIGYTYKRVGTMYNDNGSLSYVINGIKVPYPVDQAIKLDPFPISNIFFNYTIKNASWLRGSKLGLAINNLTDSHALVGVTPAVAATASSAVRVRTRAIY